MVVDVFFRDTLMMSGVHDHFGIVRRYRECYGVTGPDFDASHLPDTWTNSPGMLKCKIRIIALEEVELQQIKYNVASFVCSQG